MVHFQVTGDTLSARVEEANSYLAAQRLTESQRPQRLGNLPGGLHPLGSIDMLFYAVLGHREERGL